MTSKAMKQIATTHTSSGLFELLGRSLSVASRSVMEWWQIEDNRRQLDKLNAHLRKDAGLDEPVSTPTHIGYSDPSVRRL